MLLKLPQDLYDKIKEVKGEVSHQTFIVNLLKQQLLTKSHGELEDDNKEEINTRYDKS